MMGTTGARPALRSAAALVALAGGVAVGPAAHADAAPGTALEITCSGSGSFVGSAAITNDPGGSDDTASTSGATCNAAGLGGDPAPTSVSGDFKATVNGTCEALLGGGTTTWTWTMSDGSTATSTDEWKLDPSSNLTVGILHGSITDGYLKGHTTLLVLIDTDGKGLDCAGGKPDTGESGTGTLIVS